NQRLSSSVPAARMASIFWSCREYSSAVIPLARAISSCSFESGALWLIGLPVDIEGGSLCGGAEYATVCRGGAEARGAGAAGGRSIGCAESARLLLTQCQDGARWWG